MLINEFAHNCHFCQFRHGGCSKDKTDVLQIYEESNCQEFILGKCYFCAIEQTGNTEEQNNICMDAVYPDGCPNFKEGMGYEEFLSLIEERKTPDAFKTSEINIPSNADKIKASNRRRLKKRQQKKLKKLSEKNKGFPGPWFDNKKNRYIICGRGKNSRYLKKQAHRKVRRQKIDDTGLFPRGLHKKLFDYWWELY